MNRKRLLCLILMLFVLLLPSPPTHAQSLMNARKLAEEKKYDESISEYLLLLKKNPRDVTLLKEMALLYRKKRAFDETEAYLKKAIAIEPQNVELHFELGKTLYGKGYLLLRDAGEDTTKVSQGRASLELSLESFRRVNELKADHADSKHFLADAFSVLGRYEEAVKVYLEELSMRPNYSHGHASLAETLLKMGKLDEALKRFSMAVELDSLDTFPREGLGETYEKLGQYEDAVSAYKKVVRLDPKRHDVYKKIGDILRTKLGGNLEAVHYYRVVLETAPDSKEAKEISESLQKKEEVVRLETLKPRAILASSPEFLTTYDRHEPSDVAISFLNGLKVPTRIEVFLGTWCPDSEKHVPHLIKLLQAVSNPLIKVEYIGVDREKKTPSGREKGKDIVRIPTFIIYQGEKEIGRIVETPKKSLEEDLLEILGR